MISKFSDTMPKKRKRKRKKEGGKERKGRREEGRKRKKEKAETSGTLVTAQPAAKVEYNRGRLLTLTPDLQHICL